jgi:hypothetical protein
MRGETEDARVSELAQLRVTGAERNIGNSLSKFLVRLFTAHDYSTQV